MTNTQLVPVVPGTIGNIPQLTVCARALHTALQVKRDFSNWIKGRISKYGFTENEDYEVFANLGENPSGGRPAMEYRLSLNMGKELSMIENNDMGRIARRYFIECERRALENLSSPTSSEFITPDQQCTLKAMVKTLVEKGGHYAAIWSRFNNHFRIARYCQLPQSRMSEAVDYLMWFEVAPKALPASTPSAPPASEFPAELAELPDTRRLFKDIQAAADRLAPSGNWAHLAVRLELGNISTTHAAHAVDLHVNVAWYALGLARSSLLAALAVSKIGR